MGVRKEYSQSTSSFGVLVVSGSLIMNVSSSGILTGSLHGSASYSSTSSYVSNIKSGAISPDEWVTGTGQTSNAVVSFSASYSNTSYSIVITAGADQKHYSITNKTNLGFTVIGGNRIAMTDFVYWITTPYNNG